MDAKVKSPAKKAGLVCGILAVLLMVLNMIMGTTELGAVWHLKSSAFMLETIYKLPFYLPEMLAWPILYLLNYGAAVLGLAAYPVYWLILKARRKKYMVEIMQLTNQLLNE